MKGESWAVRIDEIPGLTRDRMVEWCIEHEAVICCRETPDSETPNPHYHIAMRTKPITRETLRNWVKKVFGDLSFKSSDFATAPWDGEEEYLRYCCKGPGWSKTPRVQELPDVVYSTLMVRLTVKQLNDDFWAKNKADGDALASKAKTNWKMLEEVLEEMRSEMRTEHITYDDGLSRVVSKIMTKKEGRIADQILFMYSQHIMYKLAPGPAIEDAVERMRRRFNSVRPREVISSSGVATDIYADLISHA